MRGVKLIELGALAAAIEFLCLRFLLRLGPFLPQTDALAILGNGLAFIGVVALNLALLLMVVALVEYARVVRERVSQFLLLGWAALTVVLFINAGSAWLYGAWLCWGWLVMVDAWRKVPRSPAYQAWLGLVLAIYLLLGYATMAPVWQINLIARPLVLALAELGAVLAALSTPLIFPLRWDWRAAIVGATGGILLSGMGLRVGWLPPTIMIWTFALTGYLPLPAYALALTLFLYTLTSLALQTETRYLASGLILMALGGLRWDYPYYVLLAVLGVVMLTQCTTETRERGQPALASSRAQA